MRKSSLRHARSSDPVNSYFILVLSGCQIKHMTAIPKSNRASLEAEALECDAVDARVEGGDDLGPRERAKPDF